MPRGDGRLNQLLFDSELMHRDTEKALVLTGLAGAVFGTIGPGAPIENTVVKLALASAALLAGLRIHPGAEKIAADWNEAQKEAGADDRGGDV